MKRNLPETDTNGALPEQSKEHPAAKKKTDVLLDLIRDGRPMTLRQQLRLTVELSVPAIIAQLSSIIMQYIDAAMVGRIGAEASASIGLVSTTTWLFWGLCTAAAETIVAGVLLWYLLTRSEKLSYRSREGSFRLKADTFRKALRIGFPMGIEHVVICGAQILTTVIVAPLGVFAIAANSFAITAESLCYMPGYGIADAATTLVGQSIGAGRKKLTRSFAHITVLMGMAIMGVMGILMYLFAPQIIGMMTPVEEIRLLGVMALRIEAFAEPMFAASIVAYGVFVGAADTLVPCLMNLFSIWAVRLTLAAWLAPTLGLQGVWIAMCVELCFRGLIFLVRLKRGRWLKCDKT